MRGRLRAQGRLDRCHEDAGGGQPQPADADPIPGDARVPPLARAAPARPQEGLPGGAPQRRRRGAKLAMIRRLLMTAALAVAVPLATAAASSASAFDLSNTGAAG